MEKPFLPKELSISEAITELKLDEMPHSQAVRRLLQYSQDGLEIYFVAGLIGHPSNIPRMREKDEDGFTVMESVVEKDTALIESEDGEIRLISGRCGENNEEPPVIYVYEFTQNDIDYVSVDHTGHIVYPAMIPEKRFYIYREDLQDFINLMSQLEESGSAVKEDHNNEKISGELKALAIIAAEYAKDGERYKSGNKVNASAFKELLLKKAREYDISDLGLKKIDDKINMALNSLDIKEIK